jgi:signal transduction histidine kinase
VERLNVLVHNLRMGLGAYEFRFCSLRTIVDEAVALYRREADRRFIDFEVSMTGKSAVECSQRHAQHMMNNLVANAVKYSYRGSPEQSRYIEIRGINRRQAYEVAISNYGIGILPEEMSQIFEKGYRGVLTRDESRTGAGLGLAIAKEIADEHSGSISPESIEFEGAFKTTFTLRLPILRPKGGEE